MIEFNKEVWGLMNNRTGKLFTPLKISDCWYRGLYDSERAVRLAVKKLNEKVKDLEQRYSKHQDIIIRVYGADIDTYFGEYIPVKLKGVEINE